MDDLVTFAGQLADVTGGYGGAAALAYRMGEQGAAALNVAHGDVRVALRRQARELGLVDAHDRGTLARTALLTTVCEVLRAAPPAPRRRRAATPHWCSPCPSPRRGSSNRASGSTSLLSG
ncbi:hypothetical protein [Egibacter rhizosphaerae]|uniref:hypothetical protein n=1 Tax=Egibacter rhizosphaerae TaxID=1670831 RepID=UPI0013F1591B|nr:hypothetical protein [Egibacter rhizosphaerae]